MMRAAPALIALLTLAACDNNPTTSASLSAAAAAREIDALYAAEVATGDTSPGTVNREGGLTELEFAPAYGARPTAIEIDTGASRTPLHYYAVVFAVGYQNPYQPINYDLLAYNDADATTIFVATEQILAQSPPMSRSFALVDTTSYYGTANQVSVAPLSLTPTCALIPGLTNATVNQLPVTDCQLGTFTVSFSGAQVNAPGFAGSTLNMPAQTVYGILIP
jgi:hypothetical protein